MFLPTWAVLQRSHENLWLCHQLLGSRTISPFLQHCLLNRNLAPELKSFQRNVSQATFLVLLHTSFFHGFNYLSIASVPWTSSHCFLFGIIRKTLNFKGLRSGFYVYQYFIRKFKLGLVVSAYNPRTHWETEII